ncbi:MULTISPECIES: helix-turn-helix domain-containing protein [unclassified Streptomyces]|uniref:helix-turn-helix domain-containing protein n=1 Tax=unclassified Streptomyces TaxID=2593676 RepID=UPI002413A991|nr:helix-turn-helix transcriptional regulator [Streptomyces sp. HSG2]
MTSRTVKPAESPPVSTTTPFRSAPRSPAAPGPREPSESPGTREPLWRDLVGGVLRRERLAQGRTLKDVAEAARISMPYLSEVERGRKEASSEVLAAAARGLGLNLGDLLLRAHVELVPRVAPLRASRPVASRGRPEALCLAA